MLLFGTLNRLLNHSHDFLSAFEHPLVGFGVHAQRPLIHGGLVADGRGAEVGVEGGLRVDWLLEIALVGASVRGLGLGAEHLPFDH